MNKTGLVLKIEKNAAVLVTNTGEFVKVKTSVKLPKIGETYTGIQKKERNYLKYLTTAAVFLFIIACGSGYAYYTPVATIDVSINPSIEMKINRFDRIIKSVPLNADGKVLLKSMQLTNRNIDEALISVVDQAKKDKFITDNYNEQGKTISVKILANDSKEIINIKNFEQYINKNKINTQVDNNGEKSHLEFTKKQEATDNNSSNNINKNENSNSSSTNSINNNNSNNSTPNEKSSTESSQSNDNQKETTNNKENKTNLDKNENTNTQSNESTVNHNTTNSSKENGNAHNKNEKSNKSGTDNTENTVKNRTNTNKN